MSSFRVRPDEFRFTQELYPTVINLFNQLMYGEEGAAMAYWAIYEWTREAKYTDLKHFNGLKKGPGTQ